MKTPIYKSVSLLILFIVGFISANAQESNFDNVKTELAEISKKEIDAFKTGDCQTVSSFISDNATFYLNGMKAPNKKMLIKFCNTIQRPFEQASKIVMEYIPISKKSGYVIRTMEFSKNEKVYKKEVVTKIWVNDSGRWQIIHLHSTITKY